MLSRVVIGAWILLVYSDVVAWSRCIFGILQSDLFVGSHVDIIKPLKSNRFIIMLVLARSWCFFTTFCFYY